MAAPAATVHLLVCYSGRWVERKEHNLQKRVILIKSDSLKHTRLNKGSRKYWRTFPERIQIIEEYPHISRQISVQRTIKASHTLVGKHAPYGVPSNALFTAKLEHASLFGLAATGMLPFLCQSCLQPSVRWGFARLLFCCNLPAGTIEGVKPFAWRAQRAGPWRPRHRTTSSGLHCYHNWSLDGLVDFPWLL